MPKQVVFSPAVAQEQQLATEAFSSMQTTSSSPNAGYCGNLVLPNTEYVRRKVTDGGSAITFLHVALSILDRLSALPGSNEEEMSFLRMCLLSGYDQVQLPCALVDSSEDSEKEVVRSDLRQSFCARRAAPRMLGRSYPQEQRTSQKVSVVEVEEQARHSSSSEAALGTNGNSSPVKEGEPFRGALRAASSSWPGKNIEAVMSTMPNGLPWMGPPVPQWPMAIAEVDAQKLETLYRESFCSWDFDPFKLTRLTRGRPLRFAGWEALRLSRSFSEFNLNPEKACEFMQAAETFYANASVTPYHNNIHAADVCQSVHSLLHEIGFASFFDPMDILVLVVGAIIHDLGHDGKNNAYHINVKDDMALTYNDRSPLENFHVSQSFKYLFNKPETNFLCDLAKEQVATFRSEVIDVVLSTDNSHHFGHVGNFENLVTQLGKEPEDWQNYSDPSAIMTLRSMVLHTADISNATKPIDIARHWTRRCLREFFAQGDCEKQLGLPISPMCDRTSTNVPSCQLGFIQFIVQPTFEALAMIQSEVHRVCLSELKMNKLSWEQMAKESTVESADSFLSHKDDIDVIVPVRQLVEPFAEEQIVVGVDAFEPGVRGDSNTFEVEEMTIIDGVDMESKSICGGRGFWSTLCSTSTKVS
eukprot:TRINITY_DN18493_c0_g1_i1.p1 TRINITY_DN18493_c0_g1~~TRINITY_DN18493_c0_g1_i1.p1  ORF type:complete len:643 (-),score=124.38 TRINITY_DN18493_c0_g1_i1:111-2039(-)